MATANAATTFLENRLLSFIFKNNAASFSSPGDSIYVGLATAVSNFNDSTGESGDPTITEATFTNYARVQVTASNWTLTAESAEVKNQCTFLPSILTLFKEPSCSSSSPMPLNFKKSPC